MKTFKVTVKYEEVDQLWGTTWKVSDVLTGELTDKELAMEAVRMLLKKMEEEL